LIDYNSQRQIILEQIFQLNNMGESYQDLCDYVNTRQTDFTLYKDFFSRFRSNVKFHAGNSKRQKLTSIQGFLEELIQKKATNKNEENQYFLDFIYHGIKAEFELYSRVNKSESPNLNKLSKYFAKNEIAFKRIFKNINQKIQYRWVLDLDDLGSSYTLLESEVTSVFNDVVVVSTKEHWKLCWIDQISKELMYRFETINDQSYLLTKNSKNQWRIKDNIYEAAINKKRPEVYSAKDINDLLKSKTGPLRQLENLILINNISLAKDFALMAFKLPKKQINILKEINVEYLSLLRELNIDRISFPVYNSELQKLKTRFILIFQFLKDQKKSKLSN